MPQTKPLLMPLPKPEPDGADTNRAVDLPCSGVAGNAMPLTCWQLQVLLRQAGFCCEEIS